MNTSEEVLECQTLFFSFCVCVCVCCNVVYVFPYICIDIIMGTNFDLKIVKPPLYTVNDQIDAHSLLNASSVSNRRPVQIAILT